MNLVSKLAAISAVAASPVLAGSLSPDHPDALICDLKSVNSMPDSKVVLYLSAVGNDGSTLYQSLGPASLSAKYDADGTLTGLSEGVCGGLSLSELEAKGMTKNY